MAQTSCSACDSCAHQVYVHDIVDQCENHPIVKSLDLGAPIELHVQLCTHWETGYHIRARIQCRKESLAAPGFLRFQPDLMSNDLLAAFGLTKS